MDIFKNAAEKKMPSMTMSWASFLLCKTKKLRYFICEY